MDSTNKMAVLVVSYDGYSDLWDDFFNLFEKYWSDIPYNIYLANNTKQYNRKNLKVINCGENAQWSTRVRTALENIDEKYVCMLLEDLFLSDNVNTSDIQNAVNLMETDGLKYYKLMTFSKIYTPIYKNIPYLHTIEETLEYGISLQAAIWEKDFLMNLVGDDDYNAWKFEADYHVGRTDKCDYKKCVYDDRNVLNICHGVVQGKILRKAINDLKKIGYNLDTSKRDVMPLSKEIVLNIRIFINNQRIPRPIIKAIKRFFKLFGFKSVLDSNK